MQDKTTKEPLHLGGVRYDNEYWMKKVKNQPDVWIILSRDEKGNIVEVMDKDTGYTHVKTKEGWFAYD